MGEDGRAHLAAGGEMMEPKEMSDDGLVDALGLVTTKSVLLAQQDPTVEILTQFGETAKFRGAVYSELLSRLSERDALKAENAALKEAMRWVTVSERLPKRGLHVEIVLDTPVRNVTHGFYDGDKGWYDTFMGGYYGATHWRELPQPPEVTK